MASVKVVAAKMDRQEPSEATVWSGRLQRNGVREVMEETDEE